MTTKAPKAKKSTAKIPEINLIEKTTKNTAMQKSRKKSTSANVEIIVVNEITEANSAISKGKNWQN